MNLFYVEFRIKPLKVLYDRNCPLHKETVYSWKELKKYKTVLYRQIILPYCSRQHFFYRWSLYSNPGYNDVYMIYFRFPFKIVSVDDPKLERYILDPFYKWVENVNTSFKHFELQLCVPESSYRRKTWNLTTLNVFQRVYQRMRTRKVIETFTRELYARIYAPPNGKAYLRAKADFETNKVNTIHLNTFGR